MSGRVAAPGASRDRRDGERGAMFVVVIGLIAFGVALSLAVARLGVALVARAQAENAADAAALAAATHLALGGADGAARAAAAETAVHNGGRLVSCTCDGARVQVLVEVPVPVLSALGGVARARAAAEVRAQCVVDPRCDAAPGAVRRGVFARR